MLESIHILINHNDDGGDNDDAYIMLIIYMHDF